MAWEPFFFRCQILPISTTIPPTAAATRRYPHRSGAGLRLLPRRPTGSGDGSPSLHCSRLLAEPTTHFQGDYLRFLMRTDLEHSGFLLFAHKPYLRFQNWDGIIHEIFLNCKPFFAQNSCRSSALVIDYFPLKCLCQSLKISPLSLFPQVFAANTVGTP